MSNHSSAELLWHVLFYGAPIFYHTRRSVLSYRVKFRKSTPLPLAAHVLAGLFEVFRYYSLACRGPVLPDALDLAASLVQAGTGLALNKTLLRGDRHVTRASYQVVCLWRPVLSGLAFWLQAAALHRSSVKIINAFVYTRLIIFLAYRLRLNAMYKDSTLYAIGVFFGGLLGVNDSGLSGGVPAYILAVGIAILLNSSVSAKLER